jgi:hypothetical protein
MHIIGYGVTAPIDTVDPEEVIRRIQRLGGIAVIAHPKDSAFAAIERFDPLPDGIEVWNSKYDGRYAPRPGTFALLARARRRRPDLRAFYGQDLHWRRQYRGLFVQLDAGSPRPQVVLDALRAGRFSGVKDDLVLPASGDVPRALIARFDRANRRSQQLRAFARWVKHWIDGVGVGVPRPLKAQLRRIF